MSITVDLVKHDQGPLPALEQAVADGLVEANPSQRLAAEHLQSLYSELTSKTKAEAESKGGLTSWLFQSRGNKPSHKGAYLVGSVGVGKSFLMDLFAASLPPEMVWREHFHRFMFQVHDRMLAERKAHFAKDPGPLVAVARQLAKEYKVICLDEFFVNNVADAMILQRLFETLFSEGVVLVTTSNVLPIDLYKDGLQRERFIPFIDLLTHEVAVLALEAPRDYRQTIVHLSELYISPLGRASEARLQDSFRVLNAGEEGEPGSVFVRGRQVDVPMMGNGVAFFRFDDLCNKPLGAEDYYTLIQHYRAICLADIPELSDERLSEAKRFITLIDVLYDNRILLIASAACSPSKLYHGRQAPEFERTASRLTEMQSQAYLESINPQLRLMGAA